jgi:hypothetical protein
LLFCPISTAGFRLRLLGFCVTSFRRWDIPLVAGLKFKPSLSSNKISNFWTGTRLILKKGHQMGFLVSEMSNFLQGQRNREIVRRCTQLYIAQAILKIDAEIAEKGHL